MHCRIIQLKNSPTDCTVLILWQVVNTQRPLWFYFSVRFPLAIYNALIDFTGYNINIFYFGFSFHYNCYGWCLMHWKVWKSFWFCGLCVFRMCVSFWGEKLICETLKCGIKKNVFCIILLGTLIGENILLKKYFASLYFALR